jgi:hypothetical protein
VNGYKRPLAPIEFLFTVFLCMRFPKATDSQLSDMFGELKQQVAAEHKDRMINTKVEATIRSYIRSLERRYPTLMSSSWKRARDEDEEDYEPASGSRLRIA